MRPLRVTKDYLFPTRGDQRMTYIGDQDVLLGSIMQLLLTQRDVTTGCKVLLMKSVADLSA